MYEIFLDFVKVFINHDNPKDIFSDYEEMIAKDLLIKIIGPEIGINNYNDYKAMITDISNHIPDIEDTDVRDWAKWHFYIWKYENYYCICILVYEEPTNFIESIGKESSNEYEKFVVKVIMGMLKEIFNYIYDEMINWYFRLY